MLFIRNKKIIFFLLSVKMPHLFTCIKSIKYASYERKLVNKRNLLSVPFIDLYSNGDDSIFVCVDERFDILIKHL